MSVSRPQSALLDALRGVSAQLVLFGHAVSAAGFHQKVYVQDLGVMVFFVLSGFLITSSAMAKPDYSFGEFLIDRGARMFTPYIPALIFIAAAGALLGLGGPYDAGTFIANALMLQDFPLYRYLAVPEVERFGSGRPLWSVALEWWFYMAFGALFFIRRLPLWAYPLAAAGLFVAGFNATVGMLAFTWAAGALGALVFHRLPRGPWILVVALLAYLCVYRLQIAKDGFYDLSFNLLLAATIIAAVKGIELVRIPAWIAKASAALAAFSYTLYLTHYTVMVAFASLNGRTRVLVVLVVANLVAVAMYFAFERHHRAVARWLKRATFTASLPRSS